MTEGSMKKTDILGIQFDTCSLEEAVEYAFDRIGAEGCRVVTPNPEIVYRCKKEKDAFLAVASSDLVLPDGIGILIASKILKRPLLNRITGMDFSSAVFQRAAKEGKNIYLFGAKPGVAAKAAVKLKEEYPEIQIVGTHDGFFESSDEIIQEIVEKNAQILTVCLGAPKQEIWMSQNKDKLPGVLMMGLGGALDVISGEVERAPEKVQKRGMEWLYRLFKEPRRFKRMLKIPLFLILVLKQRIHELLHKEKSE